MMKDATVKKWRKVCTPTRNIEASLKLTCYKLEQYYYTAAVKGNGVYIYGTEEERRCAVDVVLFAPVTYPDFDSPTV